MWGVFSIRLKRYIFQELRHRGNIHRFDCWSVKDSTVGVCSDCVKGGLSSKLKLLGRIGSTTCHSSRPYYCLIARSHLIGYIIRLSTTSKAGFEFTTRPQPKRHKSMTDGSSISAYYIACLNQVLTGPYCCFQTGPPCAWTSPEVEPHHNITVSWDGGPEPTDENLREFCTVRREKVLNALEWLKENNELYRDVKINDELLRTWPDDAVPPQLIQNAVRTEAGLLDHREGYSETMYKNMQSNFLDPDGPDEVFENEIDQLSGPKTLDGTNSAKRPR
jgi:hypothetical protein